MPQPIQIAPEVVACISEDRHATEEEFGRLVERMTLEIGGGPAFRWGVAGADSSPALIRRVACLALHGGDGVAACPDRRDREEWCGRRRD